MKPAINGPEEEEGVLPYPSPNLDSILCNITMHAVLKLYIWKSRCIKSWNLEIWQTPYCNDCVKKLCFELIILQTDSGTERGINIAPFAFKVKTSGLHL